MEKIKIRRARRDDLEHLLGLNQSNLPHVGSITQREMEHLHRQAIHFPVAEFNGQTAGFFIAFDPEADYASLNFIWFKNAIPLLCISIASSSLPRPAAKVLPAPCTGILSILPEGAKSRSWRVNTTCGRKMISPGSFIKDTALAKSGPRKPKTAEGPSRFKSSR